jgi:hypothetical protein
MVMVFASPVNSRFRRPVNDATPVQILCNNEMSAAAPRLLLEDIGLSTDNQCTPI